MAFNHISSATVSRLERLLIRSVNWLGDAVMTTPALMRLREACPAAQISVLSPTKLADLWLHHPAVDNVIAFSPQDGLFQIARQLRAHSFQLGLALPNSPRSAIELWLARIPQRVGYAQRWRNQFLTCAVKRPPCAVPTRKRSVREIKLSLSQPPRPTKTQIPPNAHHIYHYLNLVAALGANPEPLSPCLAVTDSEVKTVLSRFNLITEPQDRRPLCALNPGAEYGPAKRWPPDRFIAAAIEIQNRLNCRWLIVGSRVDAGLASTIAHGINAAFGNRSKADAAPQDNAARNLAGATTLRELCALLKLCRVLLTNDTGPMHVAAALGTPVVVPFGSTSPVLTGPGLPGDPHHMLLKSDVACSPCFRRVCPIDFRCMNSLRVDQVVKAVLAVIRPQLS